MKLRFTPQALAELDQILAHIAAEHPSGARRVQKRIQTILELLTHYPSERRPRRQFQA